jgi:hypothetical protein
MRRRRLVWKHKHFSQFSKILAIVIDWRILKEKEIISTANVDGTPML